MSCTLVTAYYPIKSKFSSNTYIEWGKTFLSLDANIVLFTEEHLVDLFKTLRGSKPILIVSIPFSELETWILYSDKWKNHWNIDPEKHIHTPELYAIWAQKPYFVEKAIIMNPYKTEYFFWCDFGAFRNPCISSVILNSFPQSKYLPKNKILMQSINNMVQCDEYTKNKHGFPICTSDLIAGGLWGGDIDGCLKWKISYIDMLDKYFHAGVFAGKDQTVMLSAYLKDPTLAVIVKCTRNDIDKWFFLEHLLSNEENKYEVSPTYLI
jgi:hypothetical protein